MAKTRVSRARVEKFLDELELLALQEHRQRYNCDNFEFSWRTVDHIGLWAYGGRDKSPKLETVSILIPEMESVPGWYSYIGPIPRVHNPQPKETDATQTDNSGSPTGVESEHV